MPALAHWVAGALIASVVVPAQAELAWEWLERMNNAVRMQTYTGIAVLQSADRVDTLKIAHRYTDGQEEERVVALSGEQREVLRSGGEVQVLLPEQGLRVIESDPGRGLLPILGEAARQRVGQHYLLSLGSVPQRAAGRPARDLRILPRDNWRWGYRILLDEQTAMPLELQILSADERVLERIQFAEIRFHDMLADEALRSPINPDLLETVRAPQAQVPAELRHLESWQVPQPPPGFRLSTRSWTRLPGAKSPVVHWVFSDGLASVSVYAAPTTLSAPLADYPESSGPVSMARRRHDSVLVTAMGEVPLPTVQRFSAELKPMMELDP